METKIEMLEDNRAKITVTVPASVVDARLAKEYKDVAKSYTIPGFRKGKAPRAVIDSVMGAGYVAARATDSIMEEYLPLAIDGSNLYVVGEPQFGEEEMSLIEAGKDFVFEFTMALRMQAELSSYDNVEIKMIASGATELEVDDQIEIICDSYATFEDAGDHAKAGDGDRIVMNLAATDDKGAKLDNLTTEDFQYTIGSGLFPADFDIAMMGVAAGETREFTMPMGDKPTAFTTPYQDKTQNISFKAEVTGVRVKKAPEMTDAWIEEEFGFQNMAEFRERVSESIAQQKEEQMPILKESSCLAQIVNRLDVEIPADMAEEAEGNLLQDFFRQLQRSGQTFDEYLKSNGLTNDQFKEDIKLQAQDMVKQDLALDAWARHYEIAATEDEIQAEFIKSGVEDWEALYENWKQAGRIHMIREGVVREKALQAIIAGAVVTEVSYDDAKAEEGAAE